MNSIDFEQDQRADLDGANDANKLSDQVVKLQKLEDELLAKEEELKELKRKVELVSGEVIPTMMQEMNISTLKLADGTSVEVKPVYGASIPTKSKDEAFKWLRDNGLGDLIKNEVTVAFGRDEDNKAHQVAEKKTAGLPTNMFEDDAAKGLGKIGQEDLALPFLKILGQLSPEVNKRDGKYVEGAEPGMIFNSVSGDLYDGVKGIDVVPCFYKLEYIEWKDRGEGPGAPVAIYDSSSDIMSKTKPDANYKDRLSNGNYIEKTASHFVIITGDSPSTALISMKSTQLKISRKWNSMMSGIKLKGQNGLFTPASFSHIYRLKSVQQSNDKGTWFGWEVSKVGPITDQQLYQQAKTFSENISKGAVKAKHGEDKPKDQSII
jgi:hypothetical protein